MWIARRNNTATRTAAAACVSACALILGCVGPAQEGASIEGPTVMYDPAYERKADEGHSLFPLAEPQYSIRLSSQRSRPKPAYHGNQLPELLHYNRLTRYIPYLAIQFEESANITVAGIQNPEKASRFAAADAGSRVGYRHISVEFKVDSDGDPRDLQVKGTARSAIAEDLVSMLRFKPAYGAFSDDSDQVYELQLYVYWVAHYHSDRSNEVAIFDTVKEKRRVDALARDHAQQAEDAQDQAGREP